MRKRPSLLTLTLILQASGLFADQTTDTDARSVVNRALVALGGKQKLSGITAATFKTKGKIYWFGAATEFTGEMAVQGLVKARTDLESFHAEGTSTSKMLFISAPPHTP